MRSSAVRFGCGKLTFYADDFWSVPLAVGTTLGGGNMALQEAAGALVTHYRVDVIVGTLPANQEGIIHSGRCSTENCRGQRNAECQSGCPRLFITYVH